MNKIKLTIFIGIFIFLILGKLPFGFSQDIHPPLKVPLVMSSSYCEPRPGHFHTGVDYKTQGRVGLGLFSILDGDLYRMKISPFGYGLVLYVLHHDTCMSVYAHMDGFRSDIAEFAEKLQYENQGFFLDTIFSDAPFSFEKGELIGYGGSTGHSFGPHLHFEMRKWPSENVINAQNYFPMTDNIAPDFFSIVMYDVDRPDLSEKNRATRYVVTGSGNNYRRGDLSLPTGNWAVGAEIKDRMTGTHNRYGVLEVKAFVNNLLIYHSEIDELDWKDNRIFETWFDTYYLEEKSQYIQRCFREAGNDSEMLLHVENDGLIQLKSGETKAIKIRARDAAGNWSECNFKIVASDSDKQIPKMNVLAYNKPQIVIGEGFFLEIPANAMYRDGFINLSVEKSAKYGKMWNFNDAWFAFVKPYKLALDGSEIPGEYHDKALLMWTRDGKRRQVSGKWQTPYYTVEYDKPGSFYFEIDTVAPKIHGGFKDSVSLSYGKKIFYRISDNLSGIKSYNAWIDDEWVLLKYKPKSCKVSYEIDDKIKKSQWHNWKIRVEDAKGNATESSFVFYY
ncbi:MAG: M23 family metallopeptidase [Bacteroidota bacterium]|nr:M23 family metallopeptidase [Bacteroidota bacterium]